MTKQKITEKIILNICNKLGLSVTEVSVETFFKSIGANSLDVVELIVDVEDEFQINVPDNKLDVLRSVGLLVDYVDASLHSKYKKRSIKN
jgi:acyl carrier protein